MSRLTRIQLQIALLVVILFGAALAVSAQDNQVGVQGILVTSPGTGHDTGGGVKIDTFFTHPKLPVLTLNGYAAWTHEPKAYVGDGSARRLGGELRYHPTFLSEALEDFWLKPFVAAGAHYVDNVTSQYSKSTVFPTASAGVVYHDLVSVSWKHYFEEHQTQNRASANDLVGDVFVPLDGTRWIVRAHLTAGKVKYFQPSGPDKGNHNVWGSILGVGIGYKF